MATVYLAEDLKLHRNVALKVLKPDLAAALGPERFLQEIKIAAQLHHPHILPLHDSGDADGFLYYVMPYEKGQSLREKLAREGELPVADAVRILRDVVDALGHAHEHGVVHRDIKPDNVMLSGRHALVTDFGVAKAVSEATGRHRLTTEGIALGTPAYMAPEQAAADPHIDHRADIYAVGAVAYELLTGRPPFSGNTQQEILAAHVTQAADPVTKYRESVPPALAALVMRCLEKKPADRWQTAAELIPQLEALATPSGGLTPTGARPVPEHRRSSARGWAIGAVVAAIVLAMASVLAGRTQWFGGGDVAADPDSTGRVILVADLEHSPADSIVAKGISEALRGQLQAIPQLVVPIQADLADWCRRMIGPQGCPLNADSLFQLSRSRGWHGVLTGSVRRLGPGYVFSVNLRPTGSVQIQLGASETAVDSTDLVAAVGRLAEDLSEQLVEALPSLESAPVEERTFFFSFRSLEAYRVYREAFRYWGTDNIAAVDGFRQAIRLDSTFAEAHRRLAVGLSNIGIRRAEQVRESEAAYLLRDQLRPWERGLVAANFFSSRGESGRALEEYRRLLDDFPRFGIALNNSAVLYRDRRDFAVAERLYRSAADTTMASFSLYECQWLGTLIDMGRFDMVDSLLELATEHAADTGTYFDYSRGDRLVAERRYLEYRELDQHASLGRPPTRTDYFEKLKWDQYTALVLGHMTEYDSIAAEYAGIHGELDNGRGVLLQATEMARARLRFFDDSAAARRILADALTRQPFDQLELLDRPYPELASAYAELGDVQQAERLIEHWEREVPAEYQGVDREDIDLSRGDVALAVGRASEALDLYRRGDILGCGPCNLPRFARAWEALGQTDSVIGTYERYITTSDTWRIYADAFELARAYVRLGELYEQRGDRDKAVRYYNELIELWREADPELQQQVEDVRRRVARLASEPRPY